MVKRRHTAVGGSCERAWIELLFASPVAQRTSYEELMAADIEWRYEGRRPLETTPFTRFRRLCLCLWTEPLPEQSKPVARRTGKRGLIGKSLRRSRPRARRLYKNPKCLCLGRCCLLAFNQQSEKSISIASATTGITVPSLNINNTGSGNPFTVMNPAIIFNKIIFANA